MLVALWQQATGLDGGVDGAGQAAKQVWAVVAFEQGVHDQGRDGHGLHGVEADQGDGAAYGAYLGASLVVEHRIGQPKHLGSELGVVENNVCKLVNRAVTAVSQFTNLRRVFASTGSSTLLR